MDAGRGLTLGRSQFLARIHINQASIVFFRVTQWAKEITYMYVFPVFPCIAQQLKDLCKMFTQQCQNNAVAETETPSPVNACALEPKQFTHTHKKKLLRFGCVFLQFFYGAFKCMDYVCVCPGHEKIFCQLREKMKKIAKKKDAQTARQKEM